GFPRDEREVRAHCDPVTGQPEERRSAIRRRMSLEVDGYRTGRAADDGDRLGAELAQRVPLADRDDVQSHRTQESDLRATNSGERAGETGLGSQRGGHAGAPISIVRPARSDSSDATAMSTAWIAADSGGMTSASPRAAATNASSSRTKVRSAEPSTLHAVRPASIQARTPSASHVRDAMPSVPTTVSSR